MRIPQYRDRTDRRRRAGVADTFGGEVRTATMDRICAGVSYNRFHTTAMCSPTRASLLTGRNHHEIGNGQISEASNDWDGYAGPIPRSSALVAEVLKDYGYSTAAWGTGTTRQPWPLPRRARSRTGRPGWASSTSTAFWPGRPLSTSRIWFAIPPL